MGFFFLNATWAGRPLVDALRELERRGLHLIYSSEVIQMDMTVRSEPHATEPRAILDELLREQHLHAIDGPKETLVIVRDAPRATELPPVSTPVAIDQIVVTPSHYGLLGGQPEQRQFLSREEVRALPHFSDDVYRAINRIPGAASTDVSANFNIRGGERNEVEVLLDGLSIYEPFHVKDLSGVFSTLDAEAIGAVDILTGGFPAEYGGRMSGVIDIASLTPTARRTEVGISLLNSRVLSAGTFSDDRGQWLFSFRPGYLHQVLQWLDSTNTVDPSYYDLLSKVQWQFSSSTVISGNLFLSQDRLKLDDVDQDALSKSRDSYLWLNARSAITPRLYAQNVVALGRIHRERDGQYDNGPEDNAKLHERRSFDFASLKNNTTFDLTSRQTLKGGFEVRRSRADYAFAAHSFQLNSLLHFATGYTVDRLVDTHPSGNDASAYVSDRRAVRPNFIVEAGVRSDRQSYTPDGTHVSPRLNVGWAMTPSTSLRAAWGRYVQPQGIEELQVEDGVQEFFPAQRSTHTVVGIDHLFPHGWSMRLEAYDKRLSHLRPRYENLLDNLALFPELQGDRLRIAPQSGTARGAELLVRKESNGPWSGWFSYARSSARDSIDGRMVPRSWDQRDAVTFSVNYGHADRWNVSLAGVFHSGWPTTSISPYLVPIGGGNYQLRINPGPLNDDRLPGYGRVDLRASRSVPIASGRLSFFVEAINLFNQANVSRVAGFRITADDNLTLTTKRVTESIVPLVPSFGITWQF